MEEPEFKPDILTREPTLLTTPIHRLIWEEVPLIRPATDGDIGTGIYINLVLNPSSAITSCVTLAELFTHSENLTLFQALRLGSQVIVSPRDIPLPGWCGQRRQGQTTLGRSPERPLVLGTLPVSSALLSPPWYPLPSAPVLCLRPLSGAEQPGPCLGGPAPGFPVWLAGLPLPSLPALGSGAFSACSSRPHSCWKRRQGGRERRGRIRESRFGACCNSKKTQPAPLQLFLSASEPRALARVWPLPFLVRWRWLFHFPGLPSI